MYPKEKARLDDYITRAELAKMISVYVDKIVGKEAVFDDERCEQYDDILDVNDELRWYISKACSLWIMWLSSDGKSPLASFRPYDRVIRAEFGTILSRIVYGDTYNTQDSKRYREKHITALKNNNIYKILLFSVFNFFKNTNPKIQELRWWILLMLYRSR